LFFGTSIPACLIVIDKENADNRKAIFMVDASKGFVKDGPKNRLRDQDIHKIVDTFNKQLELPKYSRIVSISEIEEKEFNLNIPRYIDNQDEEDIQDIEAHLQGGIPDIDINDLETYWDVYETMRTDLFKPFGRKGYSQLKISKEKIKATIFSHSEFDTYNVKVNSVFAKWKTAKVAELEVIQKGVNPKKLIHDVSESLLEAFGSLKLIDNYDVYQHLMAYWSDVMQDDVYVISDDGWQSGREVYRITKQTKQKDGKSKSKDIEGLEGIESKLLKPHLLINNYFNTEKKEIEKLEAERDAIISELEAMEEEHGGEEGLLVDAKNDKDKITATSAKERLKSIKGNKNDYEESVLLEHFLKQSDKITELNKKIKTLQKALEKNVWERYQNLSDQEIKNLVIEHKWINHLENAVQIEMQRISQRLTQRIKELVDRYEVPLPTQLDEFKLLEEKVNYHLSKMGYVWR
jgi:type I restriction enzyme M protein